MDGPKEEIGMKQRVKRFLIIIAGIWLLLLIMCSFVIYLFYPDLLHPEAQEISEPTTELITSIVVTDDGEIFMTDGITETFTLDSYHCNMKGTVIIHEQNDQINHLQKA